MTYQGEAECWEQREMDQAMRRRVLRQAVTVLTSAMTDIRDLDLKAGLGRIEQAVTMLEGVVEDME
jgi:hypothetical protein